MSNSVFCLDNSSSTTRTVTREMPIIDEAVVQTHVCSSTGGLREQGYYKKSYNKKPLISIVTVVYNGEDYLEETILSILNQTYENVEYLIIDGGSTDGTLDIIKKYENKIDYWISQKDEGVYDAMNKGIKLLSGNWINFMNAGDFFYNEQVLCQIFENTFSSIDIIYGDYQELYPSGAKKQIQPKSINRINEGMTLCHQGCFISSTYHKKHLFSLTYSISCDFEFIYNAYQRNANFKYVAIVVCSYLIGGMSAQNAMDAKIQDWLIVEKNTKNNLYHSSKLLKKTIKQVLQEAIKYKYPRENRNIFQNSLSFLIEKIKKER